MGAFNNSPGGCCCTTGGWFDIWYGYSLPSGQTPGTSWGGNVILGGLMRTWQNPIEPWEWHVGVAHWWNSWEKENWFIVPSVAVRAITPVRDFGADLWTIEEHNDGGLFYLATYEGNEIGRIDLELLRYVFDNAIYGHPFGQYTNSQVLGSGVPDLERPAYADSPFSRFGLLTGHHWRHPDGMTFLSFPASGTFVTATDLPFGQTWASGYIDLPVYNGGTKRQSAYHGGMPIVGIWAKAAEYRPRGITTENPGVKLDYYGGQYVSLQHVPRAELLYVGPGPGSGTLDGAQLQACVYEYDTEAADTISTNNTAFGVRYNTIATTTFNEQTGINTRPMWLEFHAGTPTIKDDGTGELKYLSFVSHDAGSGTLVKRVECAAQWGSDNGTGPGLDISPLPGRWLWTHANKYGTINTFTGIIQYFDLAGGFGVDLEQGSWHREWYINGNLIREIVSLPGRFPLASTGFPWTVDFTPTPYFGFPYAGMRDEVASVLGIYTDKPSTSNPVGTLLQAERNFQIRLFNGGGGNIFTSEPVRSDSFIIGSTESWFVVLVNGTHAAEEYTEGKCCFYSPNTQVAGAVYLVNGSGMVPAGIMHPQQQGGKIVIHPYVGNVGSGFGAAGANNPYSYYPNDVQHDYQFTGPSDVGGLKKKPELFAVPGTLAEMYELAQQRGI